MTKLWKVTVNDWGWDRPDTKYFFSKEEAEQDSEYYPAAGCVKYAGRFSDLKAKILTGKATQKEEDVFTLPRCGYRTMHLLLLGYDPSGNKLG